MDEVDDRRPRYPGWIDCVGDRSGRARARCGAGDWRDSRRTRLFVYARIVPLQVVGDLMGGTVRLAWRKVRPYVEEERRRSGSQKTFEWFQWLSTQLERYSPGKTNLEMGAHQAYQDWKP